MTIAVHCKHDSMADPATLEPHPRNPNKHPDEQINALCRSIERFGWRHPVTVSKESGRIVCGHARRLAGIALGCEVPVDSQSFENEAEELAVLVADNTIPELAIMDNFQLDEIKVELADLGFALDEIGFNLDEIEPVGAPLLEDGDRPEFIQMTFTLHDSQAEIVKNAIAKAKTGDLDNSINENSNGNALCEICSRYVG